jgi:8-amino-7-oxononanoate synthase
MFSDKLHRLEKAGLLRSILSRQSAQGRRVSIEGRYYLNFSSNDYLGLANHPEAAASVARAVARFGVGSGASRLLAGGTVLHMRLEEEIARFKTCESALLFNSGYAANTGVIPAIASEGDTIFSDELNHASIIDGCRLSLAKTVVYRHRDAEDLERLVKKAKAGRKVVVTDGVFSMDGDIAPLREIRKICMKYHCLLYIDDAHATGVLGSGKGSLAHFGIEPGPWVIQMGTFSKAFGSSGAFTAASAETTRWIANAARSFMFSTALPAHVVAASLAAVRIVERDQGLPRRLWTNRELLAQGLQETGLDIGGSETPIFPVRTQGVDEALRLSGFLYERGIYAPAVRPPSVREPRIRITVSAAHTKKDIAALIDALRDFHTSPGEKRSRRRLRWTPCGFAQDNDR